MRISDEDRFPHPVLGTQAGDYSTGSFDVAFDAMENPESGALRLSYAVTLTEPSIQGLVVAGFAKIGGVIRCGDTYFTELRHLSWPAGTCDFPPGALLNRVTIRPIVWLDAAVAKWDPGTLHSEFPAPIALRRADIVAIGPESIISVGQSKFVPFESIFELRKSTAIQPGRLRVDPDSDRVGLLLSPETFEVVQLLRGRADGRAVVMNAVYLPAIMDLLDLLRSDASAYVGRRWYEPFIARCDASGVELGRGDSVLEKAQTLLEAPLSMLSHLAQAGE